MNKIIALTGTSWLIKAGIEQSGLLFKRIDDFLFINLKTKIIFPDMEAVYARFGHLKEENVIDENTNDLITINGFPVKHPDVKIVNNDPALYNKGSNVIFAAGYWGIEYPHGWTLSFCPKLKTTEEHKTAGPFRNRLEALNALNSLTNRRNIEERKSSK